jgi:hypothetical protein
MSQSNVYIDLNKEDVIHALIALDTELSSLHRLCMEQGPFFKCIFEEISSDALRQGLKQNLPRQPANQSHSERSYWKPQITHTQIETIKCTIGTFKVQWEDFYTRYQVDKFIPKPHWDHTQSPVTLIDIQFGEFNTNIIEICNYLTAPHKETYDTTSTPPYKPNDDHQNDDEGRSKYTRNRTLYTHLTHCMYWIYLNTNDVSVQNAVREKHKHLLQQICTPIALLFGAHADFVGLSPTNMKLVDEFEVEMQVLIDKQPQEDNTMHREGIKLIKDLKELILQCHNDPIYPKPDPESGSTSSALSSLLAQLTERA